MRSWVLGMATLSFVAAVLTFMHLVGSERESAWERIQRTQTIRIGHTDEPPYDYRNAQGRVTGEAPEIARRVLAAMGITHIEWVQVQFGTLIPRLQAGRFDMIAAGTFITPQRAAQIAFSLPTFCVGSALLVARGNPKQLHSLSDIARSKARLAVMAGAVEQEYAARAGIPPDRIDVFPDARAAAQAIQTGIVDALSLTKPSVTYLAATHGNLQAATPYDPPEIDGHPPGGCGAFGFRQQDQELLKNFNTHLKQFLTTSDYRQISRSFGFSETMRTP